MNISYYDDYGLPSRRIDIVGRPHPCKDLGGKKVIPHVHEYPVYYNRKDGKYMLQASKETTNSASEELVDAILTYFKGEIKNVL